MRLIDRTRALLRALFRRSNVDAELAEEMAFHIERETAANVARGMAPGEARRAARLRFGSVDAAQEQAREERPGSLTRRAVRDVGFGVRLLRKAPAFAISSIAIVALGIGAATAIFSVVHGVLLQPLPYREPDRLVAIWLAMGNERTRGLPSAADVVDLRTLRTYEGVALMDNANLTVTGRGTPRRLQGAEVSPNLFPLLGASAALGRTLALDEDRPGRQHVVLLSDAAWRMHFGGDSGIVGRSLPINGMPHTVVGVMPPSFRLPAGEYEAWVPLVMDPAELAREARDNYRVIARLAPSATLAQARAATDELAARLAATYPGNANMGMTVEPMLADATRDVRPALTLLLGAVTLLLVISSTNLAGLFAARARARRGEFAVRLALGASRGRLVAQAIAESVPVLAAGGALGIVASQWAIRAFVASAPAGLPRAENIALSAPVAGAALLLLVLVGVAASLAPALQAWRSDFTTVVKDGGRSSTVGRERSTARRVGIAAQIAVTLPLLVGAGLLVRSAIAVAGVDLGFRPEGVATLAFEVSRLKHPSDEQVADYYARLTEAVAAVPGVAGVGLTNRIPLGGGQTNMVQVEQRTGTVETSVDSRTVSPAYFATLGIRLVEGRTFTDRDDAAAPVVSVVDERLARTYWPGESAIGKRLRGPDDRWGTVVGVVGHVRTTGVEVDPLPQVYWSYRQLTQDRMVVAVRSELEPATLLPSVIVAIRSVDPDQAVYQTLTMPQLVERSLARRRVTTVLVVAFGVAALWLTATGIFGTVSYGVVQRTREFGIRLALGASARDVTRLVVWQGLSMALAGAAVGLVFAIAAAGAMRSLVYGIAPRDLASIVGATVVLVASAAAASWLPARRAARSDPGQVLRAE